MSKLDLIEIYDKLYQRYGELAWWPAKSPYEVMVGAVLTQNTAWGNVEKAIENFGDTLSPERVEQLPIDTLTDYIRPSGFFNQKAIYLKTLTAWYKLYRYSVDEVRKTPLDLLRKELLQLKGIGKETADSILLYAFGLPTFVVDAYTKRLLTRLAVPVELEYDSIKQLFESRLPPDVHLYNNYHAMIVINAKEHCKTKPKCTGCPLEGECVGVDAKREI